MVQYRSFYRYSEITCGVAGVLAALCLCAACVFAALVRTALVAHVCACSCAPLPALHCVVRVTPEFALCARCVLRVSVCTPLVLHLCAVGLAGFGLAASSHGQSAWWASE